MQFKFSCILNISHIPIELKSKIIELFIFCALPIPSLEDNPELHICRICEQLNCCISKISKSMLTLRCWKLDSTKLRKIMTNYIKEYSKLLDTHLIHFPDVWDMKNVGFLTTKYSKTNQKRNQPNWCTHLRFFGLLRYDT